MNQGRIPNPVAVVVGSVLGGFYYSHRALDALFLEKGAPGDPPLGSCVDKSTAWLKRANADPEIDALSVLGGILEEFMEVDNPRSLVSQEELDKQRKRVADVLGRHGLTYRPGGKILGGKTAAPTRTLEGMLRARDLTAVDVEFQRALDNVETDPPTAVTSACAVVEALCKVYIEDEGLEIPGDQSVKPLWKVVQRHLGLDPAQIADDDLKRILSGLTSVVDGLGALRTHVGSAHGQGRKAYEPAARHARLALHAAHSLVAFVIETWDARKAGLCLSG